MFFLIAFGCSDFNLFSVDTNQNADLLDPCSFAVEGDDGATVLMKNQLRLSPVSLQGAEIEPGPNSEIASFIIEVIHSNCSPLTVNEASIEISGGDEAAAGWYWNLMDSGGVALQNDAGLPVGAVVDGTLEVDRGPYDDIFQWEGDVEIGVVIPGGEPIEVVLVIDTTGSGTGEYSDPVKGRFGWLEVFDGSKTVSIGTNYYGPSVEIQ